MRTLKHISICVTLGMTVFLLQARGEDTSTKEGLKIGAYFGPSIPNDNLNQIYDAIQTQDPPAVYQAAANLGYHVGGKARLGIVGGVSISLGAQYTKFPGQSLTLSDSTGKKLTVETSTNIVPVYAGLTLIPFDFIVSPYITGEVLYSYRSTSVNSGRSILQDLLGPGVELEPKQSRAGAALGFGIELRLAGLEPFVEFKYIMSNLVGNNEGEQLRSFLNISVGLMF